MIGVVVFAAILVGWVYTLPGVLKRAANGSNGTLEGIAAEGKNIFDDIKDVQSKMDKGVVLMNNIVAGEYDKESAIIDLKSKIETKQKIKAALTNVPDAKPPLNEPVKP